MESGISFIICCYNSSRRLPPTLVHLAAQNVSPKIKWEVIVVDNASTDDTALAALSIWEKSGGPAPMRIISEPRLGVGHARYRGIEEAKYEFISFIDDDNWVDPDYAQTGFDFMRHHPDVGACGSLNQAVSDVDFPWWFGSFHRSYAVGPQSEEPGDITLNRGVLWSAGMMIRKSAMQALMDNGFRPKLFVRSEDYEMCLALRLAGWKLWYEPKLKLKHHLPSERLDWKYLRHLLRVVGASDLGLKPYYYANSRKKDNWQWLFLKTIINLLKNPIKLFVSAIRPCEGDSEVLEIYRSIGLLFALIRMRNKYNMMFEDLNQSGWIKNKQPCIN